MLNAILEKFDYIEVLGRCLIQKFPSIKKKLKKQSKNKNFKEKKELNSLEWEKYKKAIKSIVGKNSIVLIHSSIDGLSEMGITVDMLLEFLLTLVNDGNTIVLPTYPITNLKKQDEKVLNYNVRKTPCWTGMLPNKFLKVPQIVRSKFPYNTLAAYGPNAEEIMLNNEKAIYVYGENSAWKYCVDHHAKILFLGVTSLSSNTIAAHMIPDILEDEWPIKDWYINSKYHIKDLDEEFDIKIKIQDVDRWAKYSTQHALEK